jgi:membrane glycosyltransferase
VTIGLLILPKVLAIFAQAVNGKLRSFGGGIALTESVFLEALFSMLLAPIMAVMQTRFVVTILAGRQVSWERQQREDATTGFVDAVRRHGGATLLGLVVGLGGLAIHAGILLVAYTGPGRAAAVDSFLDLEQPSQVRPRGARARAVPDTGGDRSPQGHRAPATLPG